MLIRTLHELRTLATDNPFPNALPNRVLVLFLDEPLPARCLEGVKGPDGEQVAASGRHLVVHYPNGMGRSKLKLPGVGTATGRNLNTVRKMTEMLAAV